MAGAIFGLATGELATGLGIGLFFELLWLDLLPAGTYIPAQGQFATLMALVLVEVFGLHGSPLLVIALVVALPAGPFGAMLEGIVRRLNDRSYDLVISPQHADAGGVLTRSVGVGLARTALFGFVAFVCYGVLAVYITGKVLVMLTPLLAPAVLAAPVAYWRLWLVASVGASLSLRRTAAITTLVLVTGVLCVLLFLHSTGTSGPSGFFGGP